MIELRRDNIYLKESRVEMLENDEITAEEEGFMVGYEASSLFF